MVGPTPVFLISLPRSGSTLLQKMFTVSPRVASVAEPWFLLPLAYMLHRDGAATEYGHRTCVDAVTDLAASLPGGEADFEARIAAFARGVYADLAGDPGCTWFLDKTPRYYLIVPFLARVFPDARFIFLYRNPLEVLASVLRTWHNDRFGTRLTGSHVDLVEGPRHMAADVAALGERAVTVHYERLVTEPEAVLTALCKHLDIPFDPAMVSGYRQVEFAGSMGDPTGVGTYQGVSTESLARWKGFVRNHVRRAYARRYLDGLGDEVLGAFGLDRKALRAEVAATRVSWRGDLRDAVGLALATLSRLFDGPHFRRVRHERSLGRRIIPYG
jgi:hypothetical protein